MKTKLYLSFAAIVFSIGAFAQVDVKLDDNVLLSGYGTSDLVLEYDKGKIMENGIFFTKSFYEETKPNGEFVLESAKKQLSKTFEVEIEQSGNYFFAAHVLPVNNVEKISKKPTGNVTDDRIDILEIRVYLNDSFIGILSQTKLDWELVPLKDVKTIGLPAGKNTIRFESDAPYFPFVDAVRITQLEKDLIVENEGYDAFIALLKSNPSRELPVIKETQEEVDRKGNEKTAKPDDIPKFRSAQYPELWDWQVWPTTFSCPACTYNHKMNVPITFTYYRKLSLSSGSYTFNTAPISGDSYYSVDPVMYLYKIDDPHNYSWYNDDDSGYGFQSRITASNIPAGEYYLVIRAFSGYYASTSLGRQGLVNVYQNGYLLNSNAPVAGYMFDISSSNKGLLNYFTAYSTGIPIFWLQENSSRKMKFKGETYWYASPSDYYWFDDARMRLTKNSDETYSMLVAAEGAMGFYFGNCDAYGSAKSDVGSLPGSTTFPNLKSNDAIQSAPTTNIYNCTAWTGGITNGWFWGALYACQSCSNIVGLNYGSPYVWSTWDNYFGNTPYERYSGATTYTRDQANASNAEIALWSTNGSFSGITHGSIRLIGNNHPHGYDWESKAGANYRFFHPMNALENFNQGYVYIGGSYVYSYLGYGGIFAYYRDASKDPYPYPCSFSPASENTALTLRSAKSYSNEPVFTMEESIKKGLTAIEDVKLDADQMNLVKSKSSKMKLTSALQTLYDSWVETIHSPELSYVSNPYTFIETEEGKQLMDYAKNNLEESITFFANIVFANEESTFEKFIAEYLFCEIAKDRYASVIEGIKEEWADNNYDNEGRYLAPMPETLTKKYIKKLLDKVVLKKAETVEQSAKKTLDNHNLANISPNPVDDYAAINLNLPDQSTVTIRIFSQSSFVETILNGKKLEAGEYSFSLNVDNLSEGVYVCVIEINGVSYSRKFLKR